MQSFCGLTFKGESTCIEMMIWVCSILERFLLLFFGSTTASNWLSCFGPSCGLFNTRFSSTFGRLAVTQVEKTRANSNLVPSLPSSSYFQDHSSHLTGASCWLLVNRPLFSSFNSVYFSFFSRGEERAVSVE